MTKFPLLTSRPLLFALLFMQCSVKHLMSQWGKSIFKRSDPIVYISVSQTFFGQRPLVNNLPSIPPPLQNRVANPPGIRPSLPEISKSNPGDFDTLKML